MSNMSYCMFRNTESDLQGCYEDKSVLELLKELKGKEAHA